MECDGMSVCACVCIRCGCGRRGSKAAIAFKITQRYAALHREGKVISRLCNFTASDVTDGHINRFYTLLKHTVA